MFVTDHHQFQLADSVFGWLCSIPDFVSVLKAKPTKNEPRFYFFLVTIFKAESSGLGHNQNRALKKERIKGPRISRNENFFNLF